MLHPPVNLPRLSIYVDAQCAAVYIDGYPSCDKGTFAHLAADGLYSSSYLYIASIDLLQWMPGARRLGLRSRLVYLGLFLLRHMHIYVDALTHCNISRHVRICSVIALQNGQP